MPYYQKHVFFCLNQRNNDLRCCAREGSEPLFQYAKAQIKTRQLAGKDLIRINAAGCLGRCDEGPVLVIYPDNVWYRYRTQDDIDRIIEHHLVQGLIVKDLQI